MVELAVIASPYFFGRERVRMGRGVDAIVAAGLLEAVTSGGCDPTLQWARPDRGYRDDIGATFDLCSGIARAVAAAVDRGATPLVVAGNCIVSLGALAGLRPAAGATGIVWLDAHADFNTPESSVSGYLDGMALSTVAGRCWTGVTGGIEGFRPVAGDRVLLVGSRALDEPEHHLLATAGVRRVDATGDLSNDQRRRLGEGIGDLADRVRAVHLHVDLDVLDPDLVAPANEFAAPGGLTTLGVTEVVRRTAARIPVRSATIACYDPAVDRTGRVAVAAVEIARSIATAAG